jgi:hypothetical protein
MYMCIIAGFSDLKWGDERGHKNVFLLPPPEIVDLTNKKERLTWLEWLEALGMETKHNEDEIEYCAKDVDRRAEVMDKNCGENPEIDELATLQRAQAIVKFLLQREDPMPTFDEAFLVRMGEKRLAPALFEPLPGLAKALLDEKGQMMRVPMEINPWPKRQLNRAWKLAERKRAGKPLTMLVPFKDAVVGWYSETSEKIDQIVTQYQCACWTRHIVVGVPADVYPAQDAGDFFSFAKFHRSTLERMGALPRLRWNSILEHLQNVCRNELFGSKVVLPVLVQHWNDELLGFHTQVERTLPEAACTVCPHTLIPHAG